MTPRLLPVLALLAACGAPADTAGDTDTAGAPGVFTADNLLPSGDPRYEGQQMFLYDTWGTEVLDSWPPADFMLALMRDQPETFGNQFERFGFLPDPGDDLPVGFKRGVVDPEKVTTTCAICHVAELPDGRIWLGAANPHFDFAGFQVAVNDAWVDAGNPPFMTELERSKALLLGPGRTGAETGSYPQVVPADYPVYYELGQRKALNYMGTGKEIRTEVFFSIYSAGAGQPRTSGPEVPFPDDRVDAFVDFMGGIEPPPAPAGDEAAIAAGKAVFDAARCGSCHHVDDPSLDFVIKLDKAEDGKERYPGDEEGWDRGSIRTSPLHRVLQDGDGTDGGGGTDDRNELIAFIFSKGLSVGSTDGYRPNSLRGLWASAPFLHNGSVPTLEDLLAPPAERPTSFVRDGFTVDTTVKGNSNEGHAFGTELAEADKAALVAYLKSL